MDHPDLVPCAFFFIVAIVVWQLLRYTNKKSEYNKLQISQDDTTKTKLPEDHKKPGCITAIFRTFFMIIALAIPFFIVFLIFANVVHQLR